MYTDHYMIHTCTIFHYIHYNRGGCTGNHRHVCQHQLWTDHWKQIRWYFLLTQIHQCQEIVWIWSVPRKPQRNFLCHIWLPHSFMSRKDAKRPSLFKSLGGEGHMKVSCLNKAVDMFCKQEPESVESSLANWRIEEKKTYPTAKLS